MTDLLLKTGFISYIAAAVIIAFSPANRASAIERPIWVLLAAGFVFHSIAIILRWYVAGRPPFASMYESLILFSWAVIAVYFIFHLLYGSLILRVPALILALCLITGAVMADKSIKPLVPALQSRWISIHVITYFIGYSALGLAFMMGVLYLISAKKPSITQIELQFIDMFEYRLIIFGFPFLTIGMTTGSAWAQVAWGTYWGWDPKETCSLITWLVYVVYLHVRVLCGWKDRKSAWLCIVGFLTTLFTFVGVNFILPGLHSYS